MPSRHRAGVLDTGTFIDLDLLEPASLPTIAEITSITLAELHQGVAIAKNAATRAARMEKLNAAVADFDPLPFDANAAARYGTLVTLIMSIGRKPHARKMDLMIAAIASTQGLPLYTRNADDFKGLERVVDVESL